MELPAFTFKRMAGLRSVVANSVPSAAPALGLPILVHFTLLRLLSSFQLLFKWPTQLKAFSSCATSFFLFSSWHNAFPRSASCAGLLSHLLSLHFSSTVAYPCVPARGMVVMELTRRAFFDGGVPARTSPWRGRGGDIHVVLISPSLPF